MKRHLFISMLAALVMAGCSNEDAVTDSGNNGVAGEPQYLTVNLVTNSSSGLRATGDPGGAEYEEGLADENTVKKVRFYFFDADGKPAKVKKVGDNFYNYMDWTEISDAGQNMPNVEKILSATLVIQSPVGDGTPEKMVAVVNPVEEPVNYSLVSLTDMTEDYQVLTDVAGNYQTNTKGGDFVMSNSTYKNESGEQMAVSVKEKLFKTSGEALNDPVNIHVERTVAKVRLNSDLEEVEGQSNTFKTSADGSQKFGDEEIFVKFLGWNTTAVADKSRLVKKINPEWNDGLLGGSEPWNWEDYFRSFWAINATGVTYQYGAFRSGEGIAGNLFQAQAKTKFDKTQWVYVNENASDGDEGADPATPTKVIISAQLVDRNGNALEIAEYGSTRTTVDGLKTLFANNCGLYRKTTEGETTTFSKITPDDLDIKTATELQIFDNAESGKETGRYKVYIQLTSEAEKIKWYPTNNKNNEEKDALSPDQANAALLSLGAAKVWKDGFTYYYFDIKHLGTMTGVVRNHIYDAKLTSLKGLGTPVYNPDEIIYPEKPTDDDDTFIAAQIRILSWRVVNSDVSLEW